MSGPVLREPLRTPLHRSDRVAENPVEHVRWLCVNRRIGSPSATTHQRIGSLGLTDRVSSISPSLNRRISLEIGSSGSVGDGSATPTGDRARVSRNLSVSLLGRWVWVRNRSVSRRRRRKGKNKLINKR
jgi:hypothetical protein